MRLLIYLVGVVVFTAISILVQGSATWFAITSGTAVGFAVPLVDAAVVNARWLRIATYAVRSWRKSVRISAAYLFQIKVDNEYLLIMGKRFEQYQPVGGVYKAHTSFSAIRQSMNILDDNLLTPDAVSESDLRVRVCGRNLYQFVQWFESERNRETDCWREFYEELVVTKILPESTFRHIKYDRVRRRYSNLRYSNWAQSKELLIADIVELIPNEEQLASLRTLKLTADKRILWAKEAQIRRLGAIDEATAQTTRIADHALWTIDTNS